MKQAALMELAAPMAPVGPGAALRTRSGGPQPQPQGDPFGIRERVDVDAVESLPDQPAVERPERGDLQRQ